MRYDKIQDGYQVNIEGTWFTVSEVTSYVDGDGDTVIRFTGRVVDQDSPLRGTGYDGGRYGGVAWREGAVRKRCSQCQGFYDPDRGSCICFDNGCQ